MRVVVRGFLNYIFAGLVLIGLNVLEWIHLKPLVLSGPGVDWGVGGTVTFMAIGFALVCLIGMLLRTSLWTFGALMQAFSMFAMAINRVEPSDNSGRQHAFLKNMHPHLITALSATLLTGGVSWLFGVVAFSSNWLLILGSVAVMMLAEVIPSLMLPDIGETLDLG